MLKKKPEPNARLLQLFTGAFLEENLRQWNVYTSLNRLKHLSYIVLLEKWLFLHRDICGGSHVDSSSCYPLMLQPEGSSVHDQPK